MQHICSFPRDSQSDETNVDRKTDREREELWTNAHNDSYTIIINIRGMYNKVFYAPIG